MTLPIITALLTASLAVMPIPADAVDCSSTHCYAVARKTISNLGGYAIININSGNSVDSGTGITNPVWVGFSGTENFLEGGWEKGTGIAPCSSSSAKYYTWDNLVDDDGTCEGSVSGSTVTIQVSDSNEDGYWGILINGVQKDTVFYDERATRVTVGGESTDEDNALDNGRSKGLEYVNTSGTWTDWTSSVSYWDDASYTATWYSQYTDFKYYGP
jgi:hypothetical protein